ncbi:MAG: peptidoglycan DD-metalloendopeptidase family protein [Gammaproteobacteria bacterium]|nr:peptidoglycan DD-metalloendopeptidase family protein [Gammaproteobacteria bacterium]
MPASPPPASPRAFWLLLSALLLMGTVQAAGNDQTAAQQAQLQQLRARIAGVQAKLDHEVRKRGQVQGQLRATENRIAQLSAGLRRLDDSVARAQARLDSLQRQQQQQQKRLDQQKQALAAQLRAAYMRGQDSQLKLLLNAEDPASIERLLAYFQYFNQARAQRIQAVHAQLATLADINAQVRQQLQQLTGLRTQRAAALAQVKQERSTRHQTLAALNASIHSRSQRLVRMREDERSLQDLITNLQQTLADIPADLEGHHRFASLRGRLPWPVNGKLIQDFGAPIAGGRLRAQGDLIVAPMGTPVHAVAYGRVVFADWLPHFGLLVIVDHGDGYLSIYAHNQSVYVQVGDWVNMGETVATLGDSGGQNQPALYFEIRHRNVALSPRDWCHGRLPRG